MCKILAEQEVKPHKVRYYLEQRPSPPIGSLLNVSLPSLAEFMTTHSNQFANISRERMPPGLLDRTFDRTRFP